MHRHGIAECFRHSVKDSRAAAAPQLPLLLEAANNSAAPHAASTPPHQWRRR